MNVSKVINDIFWTGALLDALEMNKQYSVIIEFNPMNEQKNTCEHRFSCRNVDVIGKDGWRFCPMCGKPLKEKEWEPEIHRTYWFSDAEGNICALRENKDTCKHLKNIHSAGNLFTSREAAEKHLAMIKCVDSGRELPKEGSMIWYMGGDGSINCMQYVPCTVIDNNILILWRLGFAQPCTPEGRALLEKNIREHKEWFE